MFFCLSACILNFSHLVQNGSTLSGAALGITDRMEARPQPPVLISQAQSQDERVSFCDSDLFLPFFG